MQCFPNARFKQLKHKASTDFPVLSTLTASKLYVCEQLTPPMYVAVEWVLCRVQHMEKLAKFRWFTIGALIVKKPFRHNTYFMYLLL